MDQVFTFKQAIADGYSPAKLTRAVQSGKLQRIHNGVYLVGRDKPTPLQMAYGLVLATGGVACSGFAAHLHGFDAAEIVGRTVAVRINGNTRRPGTWATALRSEEVTEVDGIVCTTPLRTLLDLARDVSETRWEQALESALRTKQLRLDEIHGALSERRVGNALMRHVLKLRGDAPPTESLLETLAVQLIRRSEWLPEPVRQLEIRNAIGQFQGRVDLAFPDHGVFVELDGQHHLNQRLHDASRQTGLIAATGWLVARFTWDEVVRWPKSTLRRLENLVLASNRTLAG